MDDNGTMIWVPANCAAFIYPVPTIDEDEDA